MTDSTTTMDRKGEKRRDPVNYLSDDVIRHILSMMRMREIARVSTLSREWRRIVLSLPFLNVDLDAFYFSDAPSKLQVFFLLVFNFNFYLNICYTTIVTKFRALHLLNPLSFFFFFPLKKQCYQLPYI